MNKWKNIIMLFKTPIHILVCKVGQKTYVFLSRFPLLFWSEWSKWHPFSLIQFLKNSIARHFLTFTSPSSKLEFVYPPCCGVEEQMLIFSSGLTPGQVKGSWIEINHYSSERLLRVLKFGKTSNRAVENLPQSSERCTLSPTELPRVFLWVVRGAMHSG